jgi:hypothetical protein
MDIHTVIANLGHTAAARAQVFGAGDSSVILATEMRDAVQHLVSVCTQTLNENPHLADGDDCTLYALKGAINWPGLPEE